MAADKDIEIRAADMLLDCGVKVKIGRRGIVIRPPAIGALIAVSKEYLKMGFEDQFIEEVLAGGSITQAHKLLEAHGKRCARIAAVGWLHSQWKIRVFTGIATRWLLWKITPKQLLQITLLLTALSGVQDFTDTIRLARTMVMTRPRNLSPKEEGSQSDT